MLDQALWGPLAALIPLSSTDRPVPVELGVTAGMDAFTPPMLAIDLVCVVAVVLGLAWRILPRGTIAHAGIPARLGGNGG